MKSLSEIIPAASNQMQVNVGSSTLIPSTISNPMEAKIYKALETMSLTRCNKHELSEHLKTCIQLSGAVPPTIPEFQFLVDFVYDNYKAFQLKELGVAFELYAMGKLDVERNYGTFSPKFFGDVMSAYKPIAVQVRSKITQPVQELKPVQNIDEQQVVNDEINWWNKSKNKDWRLLNYQAFDILWKNKKIQLTKEKADSIKSKVKAFYKTKVQNEKDAEMLEDEEFIRSNCKKYTLSLYLNNEL